MNRIKRTVTTLGILSCTINGHSQITDSIPKGKSDSLTFPKRVIAFTADKFASSRPLNFEFSSVSPYNFKSKKGENVFPDGRITRFQQAKISTNINFLKTKKWVLGTTLSYSYTSTQAQIIQPVTNENMLVTNNFQYLFSTLNLMYFSSLFGKRTIYSSSVLIDGSNSHLERLRGIFTATMVFKANFRTKLTAGIVANIDPSAQTPFIPTFSYEHKFNNGFIADLVLPRSLYLRKLVFNNNGRISLGSEIDRTSFYLYNLDGSSQKYEYRQLDINSGLVYEHAIGKHFMLTAKSGLKLIPSGRIFKKEESFADPVYQITPDPTFYFNVGLSFNPFSVFGKKR